ncbi:MAG: polysaccharide pyruvyl transferase family protein [Tannerellaceae bacterium]|nr:polysaccharide pyruvyl transferase family protein [Tannerellaceae bacterium]
MASEKKKILILHFPNLNNYGTGMMGLVVIQALIDKYGTGTDIYCDLDTYAGPGDISKELRTPIEIKRYTPPKLSQNLPGRHPLLRKAATLWHILFSKQHAGFDKVIIVGGDDLSEYYGRYEACIAIWQKWKLSFSTPVILIGQTIGPFSYSWNRVAVRYLLPRFNVYARDPWTVEYLKKELGVTVKQSVDLALHDLPLQHNKKIEENILETYGLTRDSYITIVISGLVQEGYYCRKEEDYLKAHAGMIRMLAGKETLKGYKIVLLAHTFPPYGNEAGLINTLYTMCPANLQAQIIRVTEKTGPTRARFLLGNGLFTLTGRMHPAVSTYQTGKPAICLAYSEKYQGVIGGSLGRKDMIIQANHSSLWEDGFILNLVEEKTDYLLKQYNTLKEEIHTTIQRCKEEINKTLHEL